MAIIQVNQQRFDVDVIVFDKDGLLFDAQHFWKCLANARIRSLSQLIGAAGINDWIQQFGVIEADGVIMGVDPNGVFALASPQEEIIITASILKRYKGSDWGESRSEATVIFEESDRDLDLIASLMPKAGFPDIFSRLREVDISFGIATSDDRSRTLASIGHYGLLEDLRFIITPSDVLRGKPNPDMLELIAERTGVKPKRIAMVGDSFVDMQMAKAAGCIGIGIPDDPIMEEKMRPFATEIIDSLDQIKIV